ncbi:transmembrane and coiled-coil domain-containing protein 6 isoform X3 [Coturnix japonica]|uniref:transmembrane and coiled-coil domain-containing protein 6 isoform X3 n=1 Tax=Coturnix japonica TaxID=93934 RepID=UPI0013A5D64A|nr:transmembrane and coiled-coil domain-containing protein 6 isoform X3 [Coturnix japonica]
MGQPQLCFRAIWGRKLQKRALYFPSAGPGMFLITSPDGKEENHFWGCPSPPPPAPRPAPQPRELQAVTGAVTWGTPSSQVRLTRLCQKGAVKEPEGLRSRAPLQPSACPAQSSPSPPREPRTPPGVGALPAPTSRGSPCPAAPTSPPPAVGPRCVSPGSPGAALCAPRCFLQPLPTAPRRRSRLQRSGTAALRKARREQQLVSKRLLREDEAENGRDGAGDAAEAAVEPAPQGEVSELLRGAQRGCEDRRTWLRRLRRALQSKETQQQFVRLDGAVRTLVGLFTCSRPDVQLEAARCLHELSHSSDAAVAEACVPVTSYLLTYLSGHSVELTELCLYTLGNLVVESKVVRKKLLPQGIIPVLASCIQSPHEAVLEGLGYVLSQLLQAKEAPTEIIPLVLDSVLPQHMLRLVCSGLKFGTGAAVEFAWCLHYIVCCHTPNVELMSLGAVPALTSLLCDIASEISQSDSEGLELLICPVVRCLGNLLAEETGHEAQPQDERLLVALFIIMECCLQQHPFIVPESLWLLNNLTADEPFFCSALLSMDLLPALLQLLPHSQTVSVLVRPSFVPHIYGEL